MRLLVLALLAGIAMTAPAAAIYIEGGGPVEKKFVDLVAEYRDHDCPDDPAPCLVIVNGTVGDLRADQHVNLTVLNSLGETVTIRIVTEGHYDDPWDNDTQDFASIRREALAELAIAPGENLTVAAQIPDDARGLALRAFEGDEETSVLIQDLQVYYLAASGEPADDGAVDEGSNLDDELVDDEPAQDGEDADDHDAEDKKDTPFLPLVAAMGALALVTGFARRRRDW